MPQKDLSCYNCPNPVFTGDSSQLYTVRIWGNDSCSVVRPVMIQVRQKPKTMELVFTPSLCGDATGSVLFTPLNPEVISSYSLNHATAQSNGFFNHIPAGAAIFTITDTASCSFDSLLIIPSYQTVNASFSTSPSSGVAPLEVFITNLSSNADAYIWTLNGTTQSTDFSHFQADTSGLYHLELIAWKNELSCADTAMQNIQISKTGF
ncbi:MAG: hypothetical protein HYR91_10170 [Flavobacteriia bacterium]|nr:hypothetical protein [Flavobacteriia bacterium]